MTTKDTDVTRKHPTLADVQARTDELTPAHGVVRAHQIAMDEARAAIEDVEEEMAAVDPDHWYGTAGRGQRRTDR